MQPNKTLKNEHDLERHLQLLAPTKKLLSSSLSKVTSLQSGDTVKENTFEAKEFPVTISVPPIYLEPGEKVTIKIIKEKENELPLQDIGQVLKINGKSTFSETILSEKANVTTGNVNTLTNTVPYNNDKIEDNNENRERMVPLDGHNASLIKLLNSVQNTAIIIGFTTALIFLMLSFADVISFVDCLFAVLLSSSFGFLILFDKFYRRSLNNAKSH